MIRPARLLGLVAGATIALGAVSAAPAAYAKPAGPAHEQQTPQVSLPPLHPCQLHPWTPDCMPDLDIAVDPCIQYPDGECPFDDGGDGDDGGDETTTTTTQPEVPSETPDPTVPEVDDDDSVSPSMPTAAPATAVHASPTFTG